jgi:type IV fimbrial biogenesis protein FimT
MLILGLHGLGCGLTHAPARRGFTLIELMVTVTLLAMLLGLAAPAFGPWVRNARVRTATDALTAGLRLAQAEATRRSRQTVFFLTNSKTCDTTISAAANGSYWAIRTVAQVAGDPVEAVQCGALADSADGVALSGPTALCFNSAGRQTANATTGVTNATCTLGAVGTLSTFNLSASGSDRPLRVTVSAGGQVRRCDPARVQGAGALDGCPAA